MNKKSKIPNPISYPTASIAFMGAPFLDLLNVSHPNTRATNTDSIRCLNLILSNGLNTLYSLYSYLREENKLALIDDLDYTLAHIDIVLNILGLYNNDIDANTIDRFLSIQIDNFNSIADNIVKNSIVSEYERIRETLANYKELVNNPKETISNNAKRDVYNKSIDSTVVTNLVHKTELLNNINEFKKYINYISNPTEATDYIKEITRLLTSLRGCTYANASNIRELLDSKITKFSTLTNKEVRLAANDSYHKIAAGSMQKVQRSLKIIMGALNRYIINMLSDTTTYSTTMARMQTSLYDASVSLEALASPLNELSIGNPEVVDSIYEIHNFIKDNLMMRNMEDYSIDINNITIANNIFNPSIMKSLKLSIVSLDAMYRYAYLNKPRVIATKSENTIEYLLQSKEGRKELVNKITRIYTNFNNEVQYEKTYTYRLNYKQELEQAVLDTSYLLDMTRKIESASTVLSTSTVTDFKKTLCELENGLTYLFRTVNPMIRYVYQIFGLTHVYIDSSEFKESLDRLSFKVKPVEGADYTKKIASYERNLDSMRDLLKLVENSLYLIDYSIVNNIPLNAVCELV